jgi:ribonuclease T
MAELFRVIRKEIRDQGCSRAILVGHNAHFDLGFLNAAVARVVHKRNPFHPFSTFDTVTLAGLAYGQTVLSRAVQASGKPWDDEQAHSAVYDVERTAELFCAVLNRWRQFSEGDA